MKAGMIFIISFVYCQPSQECKLQKVEGKAGSLSILFTSEPLPRAQPGADW